jgi:hypothetical protein
VGQIFENLAFSVVFNKGFMGVGLWAGGRRQRAGARSAPIAVIADIARDRRKSEKQNLASDEHR